MKKRQLRVKNISNDHRTQSSSSEEINQIIVPSATSINNLSTNSEEIFQTVETVISTVTKELDTTTTFNEIGKIKVIKRIPKAARVSAAVAFNDILRNLITNNSKKNWHKLFLFASQCFRNPVRTRKTLHH